jgi:hypothetical protein
MIELEIQTLSETREGLLIDVGGIIVATGFTLLRQRLAQDPHGALLTMVVRGPSRKQRALEDALDAHERIISFEISPFVQGETRPHFAASRTFARPPVAAPPTIDDEAATTPVAVHRPATRVGEPGTPVAPVTPATMPIATIGPAPPATVAPTPEAASPEPEFELDFILPAAPAPPPAPAPAPVAIEPVVEPERLDADVRAIDDALPKLTNAYPQVFARLEILEKEVAAGARESSLYLAGQRIGRWVFERDYADSSSGGLALDVAMESIAVPALAELTEVEHQEGQLHIRHSPLCASEGHSGCEFFSGYLEGLLGPVVAPETLSVFGFCCRSFGADECVLAIGLAST